MNRRNNFDAGVARRRCCRNGRRVPAGVGRLLGYALATLLLMGGAQSAGAICLRGPTPVLRSLGDMVGKDPQHALDQADLRLSRAGKAALPREEVAWLHAIRASAYDNLSLSEDARRAALEGMRAMPDLRNPAHVEALNEYAYNGFANDQIDRSIPLVEQARKVQQRGSAADVCLQATLGHLLRMRDKADLAVVNMMQAYRASLRPGLEEQRIYVATAFSILMRYAQDGNLALSLNQEGIDWSRAKSRTHDLADFYFKEGWIFVKQQRYEDALQQFAIARRMRAPFHDAANDAYIDLETCEALIPLGRLGSARAACTNAQRIFAATGDASRGQAELLLARIALGQNRPREALRMITNLTRRGDAQSASVHATKLYLYRAQALAALGRPAEAYADLKTYVDRNASWNQTEGAKQTAILRARFETDRQIDRNRALQAALLYSQERGAAQRRLTIILVTSASVVILLLGYIVLASRRNRYRLLLVASSDGLTGLLNRKWTADRGAAILDQAPSQQHPISVALLDLDHFKRINDTHGHAAGDEVLRQFALAARQVTRSADVLGRWGGEEFLLIMPDTGAASACAVIDRLRAIARDIKLPFGEDSGIRFSAGVADRTTEQTLDELVATADVALYEAKTRGRNTTCIHGLLGQGTPIPALAPPMSDAA